EDGDVERVVGYRAGATASLDEHRVAVVRRAAVDPVVPSVARTCGRLPSLVRRVVRIAAGHQDRLPIDGASEVQQVLPGTGLGGECDPTGLRDDASVRPDNRPFGVRASA